MIKSSLSKAIDIISGGTPKTDIAKYWDNGTIGWLSVTDFNNDLRHVYKSEKKITKEGLENSNTKLLNKGDLIISARGTVGVLAQIGTPMCFNQSCFGLRGKKDIMDTDFLYYYLKYYVSNIKKRSQGSVFDTINLSSFDLMEIEYPEEIGYQQKIASVLSSLDSKIELNNFINSDLESMAKTLYDYWFVQFDFPDEKGKPYKTCGGKMIWNEEINRLMPEGWLSLTLGDVLASTGTGLNPRDNFVLGKGENFYVTIKNIEQGKILLNEKCDKIDDDALEIINKRSDLNIGDILFTSIEPVGITYLILEKPKNWNINESVFTIKPNLEKVTSEFLYMFLSSDYIKSYTKNVSAGSIHKGIRHSLLKDCKFILPERNIIDDFTSKVKPLLKKQDLIQKENQKLVDLRDWLLPMLMNGQVKVN
jgi:type I restriction enzyme S subunit